MARVSPSSVMLVLTTVSSLKEGRRLARRILDERLCACINMIPRIRSFYWWKGKQESAGEILLLIKTTKAASARLMEQIRKLHSYAVPEIIAFPVKKGNPAYRNWVNKEVRLS